MNGDKLTSFCLDSDQGGEAAVERAWQRRGEMCQDLPKPGWNMTAVGFKRKVQYSCQSEIFLELEE